MFRAVFGIWVLLICLLCCLTMETDAKVLGYWAFKAKKTLARIRLQIATTGNSKAKGLRNGQQRAR